MRDSLRHFLFFLKAGFEWEIVQHSKSYTLNSYLLKLAFFVDFLDTKEKRGFYKGLVPNVLRYKIPNKNCSEI